MTDARTCRSCGEPIYAGSRSDRAYCGPACRVRQMRQNRRTGPAAVVAAGRRVRVDPMTTPTTYQPSTALVAVTSTAA